MLSRIHDDRSSPKQHASSGIFVVVFVCIQSSFYTKQTDGVHTEKDHLFSSGHRNTTPIDCSSSKTPGNVQELRFYVFCANLPNSCSAVTHMAFNYGMKRCSLSSSSPPREQKLILFPQGDHK